MPRTRRDPTCNANPQNRTKRPELDDDDIYYLASIAYQATDGVVEKLNGWHGFNGVLFGTTFAIILLLVHNVNQFTFWTLSDGTNPLSHSLALRAKVAAVAFTEAQSTRES